MRPLHVAPTVILSLGLAVLVSGCGDDDGDVAVEPTPTVSDTAEPTPAVSGDGAVGEALSPVDPRKVTDYGFEPTVGREYILAHWRENGAALDPVVSFAVDEEGWRGLWNVCTTDRDRFAFFLADAFQAPGYVHLAALPGSADELLESVDDAGVVDSGSLTISGVEAISPMCRSATVRRAHHRTGGLGRALCGTLGPGLLGRTRLTSNHVPRGGDFPCTSFLLLCLWAPLRCWA